MSVAVVMVAIGTRRSRNWQQPLSDPRSGCESAGMSANSQEQIGEYDVVVVGGGAAGLSAALVLSRARRRILVADAGAPRNAPASHMHGFLSRNGMAPADLLDAGRAEVTAYGGEIED